METSRETREEAREQRAAAQAGDAAASNYGGVVWSKIQKVRRPRGKRGAAAGVVFSISASGAIASLSIARSSGSTQFDQSALDTIRRAAPFPAPPSGAQRVFTVDVVAR